MTLESGPAATDRNYWLFFALLCLGASGWFLYDYKVGYLKKNREDAQKFFQTRGVTGPLELGENPLPSDAKDLQSKLAVGGPLSLEEIRANPLFAKSTHSDRDAQSREPVELFGGLYGVLTLRVKNGRVEAQGVEWAKWTHTRDEVGAQLYWGLAPFLLAGYAGFRAYRAATLRAAVDEQGLTYGGTRIPFDGIVSLRDYSPKGWIDLYYKSGEDEKKLRIDNQKIAKFDELVEAICQAKGFENPVKAAQKEEEPDNEQEQQA